MSLVRVKSTVRGARSRRRNLAFIAVLLLVASSVATAQVTPVGGHHPTIGDGNGLNAPTSPTGGFSSIAPIELPKSRSGLSAPFQIRYAATTRAGAAGSGWEVPLSFVRRSASTTRRKPSVENDGTLSSSVPPRLFVALDGAPMLMVPSTEVGTYVPFAGDRYMELRTSGDGWVLEVLGGIQYHFAPVSSLSAGTLQDADLWLLTKIEDPVHVDRVEIDYEIAPVACGGRMTPEVNVRRIRHTFDTTGTPLFEIDVNYRTWEVAEGGLSAPICSERWDGSQYHVEYLLAETVDDGHPTARRHIVGSVEVKARNNVANVVTEPRTISRYDLDYAADPDTGLPRLDSIALSGEVGVLGPASIPLVRYEYGRFDGGYAAPVVVPRSYTLPGGGDASTLYASALSSTEVTVEEIEREVFLGSITARKETIRTRHVIRDFTGDGLPDLAFKAGAKWVLYVNRTTDAGPRLDVGAPYTWMEPAEIFEQTTFQFTGITTSNSRKARRAMQTTETWIQFMDWNGDGKLDVVDARNGDETYYWKVWINEGVSGGEVIWRPENVFIDELRPSGTDPAYPFQDLQEQVDAVMAIHDSSLQIDVGANGRFPLERQRSWPRTFIHECYGVNGTGDTVSACAPEDSYFRQYETDTFVEWRLADVNGDSYPDFITNRQPIVECEQQWEGCDQDDVDGVYPCVREAWRALRVGGCPDENSWGPPDYAGPIEHEVFLNMGGVLFPAFAHEGELFLPHEVRDSARAHGIGHWVNGDPQWSIPVAGGEPNWSLDPGPSRETYGLADPDGDGLPSLGAPRYGTNRFDWDVCGASSSGSETYYSRQTEGYVDLNGDGLPDWVWYEEHSGAWKVRFGRGSGFGPERSISAPGGFELSLSEGTCSGASRTIAGLQDLDGDGKPEVLRVDNGQLLASFWSTQDGTGGLTAGRLVGIDNRQGAITRIKYANNKREASTPHEVPFPEIVVSEVRVDILDDSTPDLVPTRYAYGTARLSYDAVLARWGFSGYERTVALTGDPICRGVETCYTQGIAVVTDRAPAAPPGAGHHARLLTGRVTRTTRLEATFETDPRLLLTVDVASDARARGSTTIDYDVIALASDTVGGDGEECFDADGASGAYPLPDYDLCRRAGLVVAWNTTSWEGTAPAPTSTANVWTGRYVSSFDSFGRPRTIVDLGDVRRYDDDTCTDIYYAVPSTAAARLVDAPSTVWVNDCGWGNPDVTGPAPQPGAPEVIAGAHFVYDNLPLGEVAAGRITSRIAERFAPDGTYLGSFQLEQLQYDDLGLPSRILKARTLGSSALQTVDYTYDRYGYSLVRSTASADDVDVDLVRWTQYPVWPSIPLKVTEPGGEGVQLVRDSLGRPIEDQVGAADGTFYVQARSIYDDTPGARRVTTLFFHGTTPEGTATENATRWTLQRSAIDALGRPIYVQQDLGADYAGESLVKEYIQYDSWGRQKFAAAPFEWSSEPFDPGALDILPYGRTFVYDLAGRLTREVDGPGLQTGAIYSNAAQDVYPTLYEYRWEDGLAIVRAQGPSERQSGHVTYGAWDEQAMTGAGRVIRSSRHLSASTRIDLVERSYDRLGRPYAVTRYKDAQAGSGPAAWITKHDSLGNQIEVAEPGVAPIVTAYDEWGTPYESAWMDGNLRRVTRWRYDGLGRLVERRLVKESQNAPFLEEEEAREFHYYDAHSGDVNQPIGTGSFVGRLSWSDAPGRAATFHSYDLLGRQVSSTVVHADEAIPVRTRSVYSASGVLDQLSLELPEGTDSVLYDYDSAGRMRRVRHVDSGGLRTLLDATQVDALGRYRHLALGNGTWESFTYHTAGRQELQSWTVRTASDYRTVTYDELDPELRIKKLGEKTSTSQTSIDPFSYTTYTYDARDRLTAAVMKRSTTTLFSHSYQYDGLGNATRMPFGSGAVLLTYAGVDPDRLTTAYYQQQFLTTQLAYDGVGNVTAHYRVSGPGWDNRTFHYDSSSRIQSMVRGAWSASFQYGPEGGLLREEVWKGGTLDRSIRHYGPLVQKRTRRKRCMSPVLPPSCSRGEDGGDGAGPDSATTRAAT